VAPREAIRDAALEAGMKMLVLFGSRVRGQEPPHSDWDLGYRAGTTPTA
jgi:predicted nucleotidyltransferase